MVWLSPGDSRIQSYQKDLADLTDLAQTLVDVTQLKQVQTNKLWFEYNSCHLSYENGYNWMDGLRCTVLATGKLARRDSR